jgi:hypothetical protein
MGGFKPCSTSTQQAEDDVPPALDSHQPRPWAIGALTVLELSRSCDGARYYGSADPGR